MEFDTNGNFSQFWLDDNDLKQLKEGRLFVRHDLAIRYKKAKFSWSSLFTIWELLGAVGAVLAINGVFLNAKLNNRCFFVWIASNLIFVVLHWRKKMYTTVMRDMVFLTMAFYGLWSWSQNGVG